MIRKCDCEHIAQDRLHGKGKRVKNFGTKNESFTCTVCGKEETKGTFKKK